MVRVRIRVKVRTNDLRAAPRLAVVHDVDRLDVPETQTSSLTNHVLVRSVLCLDSVAAIVGERL